MRLFGSLVGLMVGLVMLASSASAMTIAGSASFSASNFAPGAPVEPVTGSFDFSFDTALAYSSDSSVITNFTTNIAFSGPIYFTNIPSLGFYFTGSPTGLFVAGDNNFILQVLADGSPFDFSYSQAGASEVYTGNFHWTSAPPIPQTPIPGAVVMLLTALGGLSGIGFMRSRKIARRESMMAA